MKFIAFLFLSLILLSSAQSASRYELLSGKKTDIEDSKDFWDKRYAENSYVYGKAPAVSLAKYADYLAEGSRILDVGMGEGRNAVFLARRGHQVVGVDISQVAIKKARLLAQESGVRIETITKSMNSYEAPDGYFDAIICYYFVDRELHQKFLKWLRPGGILIYEAYTQLQKNKDGLKELDPRSYLDQGELLTLFPAFQVLVYEEPDHREDHTALLIARKPKNFKSE